MITFYLVCFLVGLMLSVVMLLGGMGHFAGHVPGQVHVPHVPHMHVPHAHVANGTAGVGDGSSAAALNGSSLPWWNGFSIMIFLCWFGAAGYLLTKYGTFVTSAVLGLAALSGLAGGALIFLFLTRVLMPHERELTAFETAVVGAVGKVSSTIRAGGTGEMVYEQMGARISAPARAEDGSEIARDEEVFVVRYEKGIAYVRKFQEIADEFDQSRATSL